VTVYFGLLFLGILRHPIFGLYAYLFVFYNHPPTRWWGVALPDLRWSLIAALVTFLAVVKTPSPSSRPSWFSNWGARLLLIYVAWMWLQSLWAVNPAYHLEGCILFTKYVILFYIMYKIIADERTFELFSWGHILGCFIFGWIAYNTPVRGRLESVGGPGVDDSNLLAIQLVTGLIFAGFMFLGFCGKKRWVTLIAIPFILNGVILTLSRGAFLGLLAGGLASWYFSPRSSRWLILATGVLAGVLFFRLAHEEFWERMETITIDASERDKSAESRLALIPAQWRMAQDYLLGSGHRGNETLSPLYIPAEYLTAGEVRSAHNTFMAILVDQGFPGALLFIALQGWVGFSLLRLKSLDRLGLPPTLAIYRAILGAALTACFFSGQFVNLLKSEMQIWLIALLAALNGLCDESVSQAAQKNASRT